MKYSSIYSFKPNVSVWGKDKVNSNPDALRTSVRYLTSLCFLSLIYNNTDE